MRQGGGKGRQLFASRVQNPERRRCMDRRRSATLSLIALLSLTTVAATAQTKPNTTSAAKKSPPVAARAVPSIKCADPDTVTACKSFKQLVEARDRRILDILMGTQSASTKPSSYRRHIAYVCPAKSRTGSGRSISTCPKVKVIPLFVLSN